ncbi:MAG: hypothetical protein AAF985_14365 [Bacteroidota bacterium]
MSSKTDFNFFKVLGVVVLFLWNTSALHAQNFVPTTVALERLEVKLADVDNRVKEGSASPIDLQIANNFISYMVQCLEKGQAVEQALEIGHTKTDEKYSVYTDQVAVLKNELQNLLQQ